MDDLLGSSSRSTPSSSTPMLVSSILSLALVGTLAFADRNITVEDSDSSISLSGASTTAQPCTIDDNGNITSGQAGCYNVRPSNCTENATVVSEIGHGMSGFKFYGSAVYVNTLLNWFSPEFNVTIDGETTSVQGNRDSGAFTCSMLFQGTGLDANSEHELSVIITGPGLNSTLSDGSVLTQFLLDNIIVTVPDDARSLDSPASGSASSATTSDSPATTTTDNNGALSILGSTMYSVPLVLLLDSALLLH